MDVSQVQASIEAVNNLVKIAVSQVTSLVYEQVQLGAQLKAAGASQPAPAEVAPTAQSGVGQLIDLVG